MLLRRQIVVLALAFCACASILSAQESADAGREAAETLISVWLPAPLIGDESGSAVQLLNEHTAIFSLNNDVAVEFRIKDVGKLGGIMSTIRAGKDVAPGALPDLALIPRRDFTPSQALRYLQSMETLFSSSLINDLGSGLAFGQVPLDEATALYGLPYLFDLLLTVSTQPLETNDRGLRFADILANDAAFRFPAARSNGFNQTFYLQYLAAGGLMPQADPMAVDEEALLAILTFYQNLLERQLITADVLAFQTPAAYRTDFLDTSEQMQFAIFAASDFLEMITEQDATLFAGNIPTSDGESLSIRDGWLWVIVTPDLSRQAASARFLEWMTEPGFHADFAAAVHHLPSQSAALDNSLPDSVDRQFFTDLVSSAILPLPENEGGMIPRLMQEALDQVLQGEASAEEATRQLLGQVADR